LYVAVVCLLALIALYVVCVLSVAVAMVFALVLLIRSSLCPLQMFVCLFVCLLV
jgi:hypothetical protein